MTAREARVGVAQSQADADPKHITQAFHISSLFAAEALQPAWLTSSSARIGTGPSDLAAPVILCVSRLADFNLQILRNVSKLVAGCLGSFVLIERRTSEAVVDVIMDQHLLGVRDRLLDCVQLLRKFQTTAPVLDHGYGRVQVTLGASQALQDLGVRGVEVLVLAHDLDLSYWIG